jgi:hypothetical protein
MVRIKWREGIFMLMHCFSQSDPQEKFRFKSVLKKLTNAVESVLKENKRSEVNFHVTPMGERKLSRFTLVLKENKPCKVKP